MTPVEACIHGGSTVASATALELLVRTDERACLRLHRDFKPNNVMVAVFGEGDGFDLSWVPSA